MTNVPLAVGDKIECRTGNGDERTFTPWIDGVVSQLDGEHGFFVKVRLFSAITGMKNTSPANRLLQIWRAWNTENKYWRRLPEENGKNPMKNILRVGEKIEVRNTNADGSFSPWLKAIVNQVGVSLDEYGQRAFFAKNEKKISVYRLTSNENETWRRIPAKTLSIGEMIQYSLIEHKRTRWYEARVTEIMGDYGFLVEPKGGDRIVRLWVNEEDKKWRRTSTSTSIEPFLKLCPGCNSTASLSSFGGDSPPDDDPHEVTCDSCQFYAFGTTKEEAIETWNTRYTEPVRSSEEKINATPWAGGGPVLDDAKIQKGIILALIEQVQNLKSNQPRPKGQSF